MIDTHTHLYFPEYGEEIKEVMKRCEEVGVSHFVLPNVNEESISQVKEFHARYPEVTTIAAGLHPTEVDEDWEKVVRLIDEELATGEYKAVGEIGIDLYWDTSRLNEQKKAFESQMLLAEKYRLPVIIHSRSAFEETLEVIEKVKPTVALIFHSFTGSKENVEQIRRYCDPYFGINGVVTYKNAPELREALPAIGLERIVLETDAPYLSPVPHRGKRNDSSYMIHVRDKIAEVMGVAPEEVEHQTDKNACDIFAI